MHVQLLPVYVLTCGAHDSTPLLILDVRIVSHESRKSPLHGCDLYDEM